MSAESAGSSEPDPSPAGNGQPPAEDGIASKPSIIAGAYHYKAWWTTVWLRDGQPRWPERCACCGSERDLQKATCAPPGDENAREVDYPICGFCLRHARMDQKVVGYSAVVSVVFSPLLYLAFFGFAIPKRLGLGTLGLLILVAIIAVFGAVYQFLSRRNPKGHDCAEAGWPVEPETDPSQPPVLGEKNERTDDRQARMLSKDLQQAAGDNAIGIRLRHEGFALDFIRLNGGNPDGLRRIEEAI